MPHSGKSQSNASCFQELEPPGVLVKMQVLAEQVWGRSLPSPLAPSPWQPAACFLSLWIHLFWMVPAVTSYAWVLFFTQYC